jgi:ferritin-like metal-binding protein YciE
MEGLVEEGADFM